MCTYQSSSGQRCARASVPGTAYCVLHFGLTAPSAELLPDNRFFQSEFDAIVASGNGDWEGFTFPPNIRWPPLVSFAVNARRCRFSGTELDKVIFEQTVNFSDSVFDADLTVRSAAFKGDATFDRCRFGGRAEFLNAQFERGGSFYRAEFSRRTVLRANFSGPANFNEVVFRDSVNFSGWRNVNLHVQTAIEGVSRCNAVGTVTGTRRKPIREIVEAALRAEADKLKRQISDARKRVGVLIGTMQSQLQRLRRRYTRSDPNTDQYQVFAGEGQMQDVIFAKPEQTLFSQVDLSRVYLRGTNLRGVRFLGVNWWQPKLGRNGLHDEIFIRLSQDGPFRYQNLPVLEETCRNVRVALEESRSFNVASDFYIAEMEAVRARLSLLRRTVFSVPAMYRMVSNYGTSVWAAFRTLILLVFVYVLVTVGLETAWETGRVASVAGDAWVRAIRVLIFQTSDLAWHSVPVGQVIADSMLRVLGLIQIAMLVLAFRSRIKRH